MASFSIRAARPEDCSDLLRLIKVRAAAGGGGAGRRPVPARLSANRALRKAAGG